MPNPKRPILIALSKGALTIEITFWDMGWGPAKYVETAKKLVDQFNAEHPKIKVNYQSIS